METLNQIIRSKTDSNFNELVPKLLDESNKLAKELKFRLKINSFFSEFESRASNQFNFFIKESGKRYRGSRSGCNLDALIAGNRKKCLKEANKIIHDNFYTNKDILSEREKMKKKTTNSIYKHLKETLSELKSLVKSKSFRHNIENHNNLTNIKYKKILDKKENYIKISNEKLFKDKNDIDLLLNNEKKLIKGSLDIYKNQLTKLKTINREYSTAHKKMLLNLPKINLLTYEKNEISDEDLEKQDMRNRVNIEKLLPYTRLGKNLGYTPYHTISGEENNKKTAFMTEPNYRPFIYDYEENIKYSNNTNDVVYSTANREFNIKSTIEKKRKKIENILKVNDIPKIENYETIIKDIFRKRKIRRKLKFKNKFFDYKKEIERLTSYDRNNRNLNEGINILNQAEKKLFTNTLE